VVSAVVGDRVCHLVKLFEIVSFKLGALAFHGVALFALADSRAQQPVGVEENNQVAPQLLVQKIAHESLDLFGRVSNRMDGALCPSPLACTVRTSRTPLFGSH
jgi:hypothetical protein